MGVNLLAVLAAAVLYMVVGYLWYGPLFAKPWMKLVGISKKDMQKNAKSMPKLYISMFILAFITSYILAITLAFIGVETFWGGVEAGILLGVALTAATSLSTYLFEGRPMKLFFINYGYQVICMALVGGLVAIWR